MIILLDMDDVVAQLCPKWIEYYNLLYDDNLTLADLNDWEEISGTKKIKCSLEQYRQIIDTDHFFADLEVVEHSQEITKKLITDEHDLWFVTATPLFNKTAGYDKNNWVEKYFPHIGRKKIIQTSEKYQVKGDLLFDDRPRNLELFTGISVAMNMAYNQKAKSTYRVNNWLDFYELITKITTNRS